MGKPAIRTFREVILPKLQAFFPELTEPEMLGLISSHGRLIRFHAGDTLIAPGQLIPFLPFLTEGAVQVLRQDADGREIFLYFLHPGETCAVTLNCCRPAAASPVHAIAEEDGELIALPNRFLEIFLGDFPSFRNLVLNTYAKRFDGVLEALDAVAFTQLDQRLLRYLGELSTARNTRILKVTHQEIAAHMATTREVISRLLKQLERLGRVQLGRNSIGLP